MSDDQRLREAYASLAAQRVPRDRADCAAPDALLAVVERRGAEGGRLATMEHVMRCTPCRQELDLLRAAARAAEDAGAKHERAGAARLAGLRQHPARTLAAAAGLAFVVGVGVIAREGDDDVATRRVRGGQTTLTLLTPAPSPDGSIELRWHRVPNAVQYRIDVFDTAGRTVAGAVLADTTFVLPAAAAVDKGRGLRYIVTATQSDASEVTSVTSTLPR